MTTTIQKWGNSQGIRIPRYLLEALKWNCDEELVVSAKDDKLIIEKANKRKDINELFYGFNEEYQPVDMDWGSPKGEEIW